MAVRDMPGKLAPLGVIPKGVSWLLQMQQHGMLAETGHRFKKMCLADTTKDMFTVYEVLRGAEYGFLGLSLLK